MTKEKAQNILNYLIEKQLAFIFLQSTGEMITREYCTAIIRSANAWNK